MRGRLPLLWVLVGALGVPVVVTCSGGVLSEPRVDAGTDGGGPDGGPGCGSIVCPEGTQCVDGLCVTTDPCAGVSCENPGEVCSGGVCVSGERDGDGDGYPAREDCNDDDDAIFPGAVRVCVDGCGEGLSTCGVDGVWSACEFESNPCDLAHADSACVDGACAIVACRGGWADCDHDPATGCEIELGTDANCSACGDECTGVDRCEGGTCRCTPDCAGAACGASDGCGGRCSSGSCPPNHSCEGDTCVCHPDCSGAICQEDDGCGGRCSSGSCPPNERCGSSGCYCPGPNYGVNSFGYCVPSCGTLLGNLGYYDDHSGCCASGCASGVRTAGGPGDSFDCTFCCEGNLSGPSCS